MVRTKVGMGVGVWVWVWVWVGVRFGVAQTCSYACCCLEGPPADATPPALPPVKMGVGVRVWVWTCVCVCVWVWVRALQPSRCDL